MMKRRLLAIGASLLLTAALLPTAWAAEQSYIVDGQPAAYASLADAAAAGASVQLTGDETVPAQILVTKPLTVDLNGHTLKKGKRRSGGVFRGERRQPDPAGTAPAAGPSKGLTAPQPL